MFNLFFRDIKPHNVMLDVGDDGEDIPVLMDFGSMGPARQDIRGTTQAQAMQVTQNLNSEVEYGINLQNTFVFRKLGLCIVVWLCDIWIKIIIVAV